MAARQSVVLVLLAAVSSLGASYRTPNFVVEAPTQAIAEQVGQYAEYYRREKAMQWLGQEMPAWSEPCPVRVTVTPNDNGGGATSFAFDRGRVLGQNMQIEGSMNRLLASVLPHEVTHTVFAYYFRQPVPRWADEGGAVFSEDEQERQHHDALVRNILNTPGRAIPLRPVRRGLFGDAVSHRPEQSPAVSGVRQLRHVLWLGRRGTQILQLQRCQ
jgi:hypothetical protein